MKNLLEINNLYTTFRTYAGKVYALNNVSFNVGTGEAVGVVGESGSGKSVTMLSIMRLLAENGFIESGNIIFDNKNLSDLTDKQMQDLRGNEIGMIFQDPMTSLNPVFTIGNQLVESILKHTKLKRSEAKLRAIELLKLVEYPVPKRD